MQMKLVRLERGHQQGGPSVCVCILEMFEGRKALHMYMYGCLHYDKYTLSLQLVCLNSKRCPHFRGVVFVYFSMNVHRIHSMLF